MLPAGKQRPPLLVQIAARRANAPRSRNWCGASAPIKPRILQLWSLPFARPVSRLSRNASPFILLHHILSASQHGPQLVAIGICCAKTASVRTLRAMQQLCHHQRFTDVSARARQHGILPVPCMGLHSKTLFLTVLHSHSHTANHLPSSARQQHNPTGSNSSTHSHRPSALVGAGRDVPGAPAEQPSTPSSQESGQLTSGSNSTEAAGQVPVPPPPRPPISADAAQVGMVEALSGCYIVMHINARSNG